MNWYSLLGHGCSFSNTIVSYLVTLKTLKAPHKKKIVTLPAETPAEFCPRSQVAIKITWQLLLSYKAQCSSQNGYQLRCLDRFLSSNLQALSSSDQIPPKTYGFSNNLGFSKVSNGLRWVGFIPLLNFVSLDTLVHMIVFMLIAFYAYCFLTGNLSAN